MFDNIFESLFNNNPIILKEIKCRMRSRMEPRVQKLIIGSLCFLLLWIYFLIFRAIYKYPVDANDGFYAAYSLLVLIIWLLCPVIASNTVTQEKEQQTWQMLCFSLLKPYQIVFGKFIVRMIPPMFVIFVFLPFLLFSYSLSTIPLTRLLLALFFLCFWSVFLTTVSMYASWRSKRTSAAITLSFLVVIFLVLGTSIAAGTVALAGNYSELGDACIWLNPVRIVIIVMDQSHTGNTEAIFLNLAVLGSLTIAMFYIMITRLKGSAMER